MTKHRHAAAIVALASWTLLAVASAHAEPDAVAGEWTPLFNGKDLDGWNVKIKSYPAGENFGDTFRVEDGLLKVRYDQYEGPFRGRFGHLFYNHEFSHYLLRVEYRFIGEQYPTRSPGWALRNSGIMIHGQRAESMETNQDFPASIEVQLLGGDGKNPRSTGNLCTPSTNVVLDGKLHTQHCTNSSSDTFHGEQWVMCEVEVRGHQLVRHKINGKTVLEYSEPQLDASDEFAQKLIASGADKRLSRGTISLQSESHPVDFRKVEISALAP